MEKLLKKKKWHYIVQLFKDGVALTQPEVVKLNCRPAMPWFGIEVLKWLHEITITFNKACKRDFLDVVPHIAHLDSDDNIVGIAWCKSCST